MLCSSLALTLVPVKIIMNDYKKPDRKKQTLSFRLRLLAVFSDVVASARKSLYPNLSYIGILSVFLKQTTHDCSSFINLVDKRALIASHTHTM